MGITFRESSFSPLQRLSLGVKLTLVTVKQSSKRNCDNITKPKPVLIPLDYFYEITGVAGEY